MGLALALFCDLRYVSATAKLTTAAPRLGLPAEFGLSWVLPRLVGVPRAADLLLSGRVVTGADTADWGLWNAVAPDGESALDEALESAHRLAAVSPASVAATKRQLYDDLLSLDVGASVEESKRLLDRMMGGADYREGVAALREKRPPRLTPAAAAVHCHSIVTVPVPPSTSTSAPSGMRLVASTTLTAQGMPSSRLTITAWLFMAPTSTITPAAGTNRGVQDGSVFGATRMSPGSSASGSPGSSRTRAGPAPRRRSPVSRRAPLRGPPP